LQVSIMEKLVITVAPTGNVPTRQMNPDHRDRVLTMINT